MKIKRISIVVLCVAFVLSILTLNAQTVHTVLRGETISGIARRYNVSEEALRAANPVLMKSCHVGMKLNIPQAQLPSNASEVDKKLDEIIGKWDKADVLWEKGDAEFERKNWKKALGYFKQALDLMPEEAGVHYNIGACYYNMGKYKKALASYRLCRNNADESSLKKKASEMIDLTHDRLEEKRRARAKMWGTFGAALAVAAAGTAVAMASSGNSCGPGPAVPAYSGGMMGDYATDVAYSAAAIQANSQARMMMQQNLMLQQQQTRQVTEQANQQLAQATQQAMNAIEQSKNACNDVSSVFWSWWNDFEKNPQENPQPSFVAAFKKKFGREPNSMELEVFNSTLAGMFSGGITQFGEASNSVYDSFRDRNEDRNAKQQETIGRIKDYYKTHYGEKDCYICHRSGTCQTCNGNGIYMKMGKTLECPNCLLVGGRRSGKCATCQGRGTVYGVK